MINLRLKKNLNMMNFLYSQVNFLVDGIFMNFINYNILTSISINYETFIMESKQQLDFAGTFSTFTY